MLLAAGASVEVLEPVDVRDRLIRAAKRIVERYEPAPAVS